MTVVGFVFARGGSKGVPGKNLRTLGGESLVARAVRQALASRSLDAVYVSTDSEAIADDARAAGAEVPFMRPAHLATDGAAELDAWKHAISFLRESGRSVDVLASIPPTAPLRRAERIDDVIERLADSAADVALCGARSGRNPYFNMVELDPDGRAHLCKRLGAGVARRQDAPPVYALTTVAYAARADFVLQTSSLLAGAVSLVEVSEQEALDVDTELDLRFAEFLLAAQPSDEEGRP